MTDNLYQNKVLSEYMKVYIKSAINISDLQAKIANKQAIIDKKRAWIEKKEVNIKKKLDILSKKLSPEDYNQLVTYIDYLKTTYRNKIPSEYYFNRMAYVRQYGWGWDSPEGKAIDTVDDDAESIYNANKAIQEAEAILEKYNEQLHTVKQKEKQIDEIPEVLKEFMNQLIDEWDRFDIEIRDNSKDFYYELKHKMDELGPTDSAIFDLYPRYKERFEKADRDRKFWIKHEMRDTFKDDYLNIPFKKKFGVSVDYAMDLWYMDDDKIHAKNVQEGKRVILDLTNRVTKITGPITSYEGLYLRPGNDGWTVLNGFVEGEDGRAEVETILASGPIQRLHMRTLVKPIR